MNIEESGKITFCSVNNLFLNETSLCYLSISLINNNKMHIASVLVRNTALLNPSIRPSSQTVRNVTKIASYCKPVGNRFFNGHNLYGTRNARICSYNQEYAAVKKVSVK